MINFFISRNLFLGRVARTLYPGRKANPELVRVGGAGGGVFPLPSEESDEPHYF